MLITSTVEKCTDEKKDPDHNILSTYIEHLSLRDANSPEKDHQCEEQMRLQQNAVHGTVGTQDTVHENENMVHCTVEAPGSMEEEGQNLGCV